MFPYKTSIYYKFVLHESANRNPRFLTESKMEGIQRGFLPVEDLLLVAL